jgi:hypothetical protein
MKKNTMIKTVIVVFLLLTINVSFNHTQLLMGADSQVVVTLKDERTHTFEYGSFNLNWSALQVKDEFTCTVTEFEPAMIKDIYVLGMSRNSCDKKDDQLFDIHLGKRAYQGFCPLSDDKITGKLVDTGEEKSIPYKDIKKISFVR